MKMTIKKISPQTGDSVDLYEIKLLPHTVKSHLHKQKVIDK